MLLGMQPISEAQVLGERTSAQFLVLCRIFSLWLGFAAWILGAEISGFPPQPAHLPTYMHTYISPFRGGNVCMHVGR